MARTADPSHPPADSTGPSSSRVAVWLARVVVRLPVRFHDSLAGSFSSVLVSQPLPLKPPLTGALPLGSKVSVCPPRASCMAPVSAQVPLAGS